MFAPAQFCLIPVDLVVDGGCDEGLCVDVPLQQPAEQRSKLRSQTNQLRSLINPSVILKDTNHILNDARTNYKLSSTFTRMSISFPSFSFSVVGDVGTLQYRRQIAKRVRENKSHKTKHEEC